MLTVRRAEEKDIPGVLGLLSEVLEIHAGIRPDIFVPGTTKYTEDELAEMFRDDERPVYVAAEEDGRVLGYAFCVIERQPDAAFMVPFESFYIDDLCVEASARKRGIGAMLFRHVKEEAVRRGFYEITLNVWEGNDAARRFYESMGMKPKKTQMELVL